MTGLRLSVLGSARTGLQLKSLFEAEGLAAEIVGGSDEHRSADQYLEWFKIYVIEKAVDASLGRPIDSALRSAVDRVVRGFRERYPNIRVSVDDD